MLVLAYISATIAPSGWQMNRGHSETCAVVLSMLGGYEMVLTLRSQLPVSVSTDNILRGTVSIQGTQGSTVTRTVDMGMLFGYNHYIQFFFGADGLEIDKVELKCTKPITGFRL